MKKYATFCTVQLGNGAKDATSFFAELRNAGVEVSKGACELLENHTYVEDPVGQKEVELVRVSGLDLGLSGLNRPTGLNYGEMTGGGEIVGDIWDKAEKMGLRFCPVGASLPLCSQLQ